MSPGGRCRQQNYGLNAEPLGHGDEGRGPTRAGSQDRSMCVCVYVRDAICSQLFLTTGVRLPRSRVGHPTPSCFSVFVGGFSCTLCKDGGGCKAEHRRSGGYRAEIWVGDSAVPLQTSLLRGSHPSPSGFGYLCISFQSACLLPSGSLWGKLPLSAAFSCSVTASSLFSSLPPTTTVWKAQWLPGQDDFRGAPSSSPLSTTPSEV